MKIKIHLFGVLGIKIPELNSPEGVDIEVPDGATVRDVLNQLRIPDNWGVTAAMDSRLLKYEDPVRDGAEIRLLQTVHGG